MQIVNKKARFEYFIVESFNAGIQLTGTEIKSIRQGKASLTEAHCVFEKEELFIKNMHIAEYTHGNIFNHEPLRIRKLLLTKKELKKLFVKVKEKGLTIIPLKLFFSGRGFAKIEIGLAKGKKLYDKRETIKERDLNREEA
jgi:SsrA-binding protein